MSASSLWWEDMLDGLPFPGTWVRQVPDNMQMDSSNARLWICDEPVQVKRDAGAGAWSACICWHACMACHLHVLA